MVSVLAYISIFDFAFFSSDISAMHALPIPAVAMSTQINKKRPNVNKKPNQQATVSTSDSQLDGVEPVVIRVQFF